MKVGLYFGTFNPIHKGHLIIAGYMANKTDLDEVWFIVSPQNPLKKSEELLDDNARFKLVEAAIKNHPGLKASDVEFHLPKPSYTVNTLTFLKNKYPEKKFVLIVGEDNLRNFHRWKEHRKILDLYELYVYPRTITNSEIAQNPLEVAHPNIRKFDLQLIDISATKIREGIRNKEDVSQFLPKEVHEIIVKRGYFLKNQLRENEKF